MAIPGLRNSDSVGNPNGTNRPGQWRNLILRLYPYGAQNAPLAALTSVMKSEATVDPIFHWFTKKTQSHRFVLGADLANVASGTAAVMTIDATGSNSNAYGVKAGDVLMVEQSGELMYVTATPATDNTISVIRGFDGSAGAAVTYNGAGVNPNVLKIGSAYEEGSAAPDPIGWDPAETSNQTQIFRETFSLTGTAAGTVTRTGETVRESKADCLEAFTVGLEKSFIFGKKRTTTRNNQPLRMSDGILAQLPSERKVSLAGQSGLLSLKYWETLIATMFRYGSREKMAWCGVTALLAITQMVRLNSQLQWSLGPMTKEYGMDVQRLMTPMGTLVLKIHPLFGQMTGGVTGGTAYTSFDNAILVLDMANLKYRYLTGRDVTYQPNLQLPGVDGMLAGYLAECGLELHHPETHMLLTGVLGGAKDA
ncbi:putative major capsid protein [Caulobacter phage Kuura]|nr:putative major capsid protein [Caulobacter phage Kuura]